MIGSWENKGNIEIFIKTLYIKKKWSNRSSIDLDLGQNMLLNTFDPFQKNVQILRKLKWSNFGNNKHIYSSHSKVSIQSIFQINWIRSIDYKEILGMRYIYVLRTSVRKWDPYSQTRPHTEQPFTIPANIIERLVNTNTSSAMTYKKYTLQFLSVSERV